MAIRKDEVQLFVTINGEKAGGSLKQLRNLSRDLKRALSNATDPAEVKRLQGELQEVNTKIRNITDATKAVKKVQNSWLQSVTRVGGTLLSYFAFERILSGLSSLTSGLFNTSIDLDAIDGKFNTVFGTASAAVEESAERQAIALGLTRGEYLKSATAVGDLLIPMQFQRDEAAKLSTDLIGLSGALSVWSNGERSAAEVSDILTKALLGEREQLKTLGISIQEADVKGRLQEKGMAKLTGTALQQAKAIATLELITEKSADAQTKFASGTRSLVQRKAELQARVRQLFEDLSRRLVPVFEVVLTVIERVAVGVIAFARGLASVPKFISDNRVAIGALTVALIALNAQQIIAQATLLRSAIASKAATIATAAQTLVTKGLNAALKANPIGLVVSAIALLVAGFATAYRSSEKVRGGIAGLANVAREVFTIIKEAVGTFVEGFNDIKDGNIGEGLKKIGQSIVKSNPIAIALNEGERLGDAFNKGYDDKISSDRESAEAARLRDEAIKLKEEGYKTGESAGQGIIDGINDRLEKETQGRAQISVESLTSNRTNNFERTTSEKKVTIDDRKVGENRIAEIEQETGEELRLLEKSFLLQLTAEEEYIRKRLELKRDSLDEELAILDALGLSQSERFEKIELEKLRIQKDIDDKIIEQTKRTEDIKAQVQQAGLETFQDVIDTSIGLLAKDEQARRKNAGLIKAFETGKILVNSYTEISEIFKSFATLGPIGQVLAGIRALSVSARAAGAISKVNATPFYTGGEVPGFSGQLINAAQNIPIQKGGDRILATLKPGEVVLNQEQQNALGGAKTFADIGVPGFNTGGLVLTNVNTTPPPIPTTSTEAPSFDPKTIELFAQAVNLFANRASKPIKANVVYDELQEVGNDIAELQTLSAL